MNKPLQLSIILMFMISLSLISAPKYKKLTIQVAGLLCTTSGKQIKKALRTLKGVNNIKATWKTTPGKLSSMNIRFNSSKIKEENIYKMLKAYGLVSYENDEEIKAVLNKYKKTYKFKEKSIGIYVGKVRNVMCATGKKNLKANMKYFSCIRNIKTKRQTPNSSISFEYPSDTVKLDELKKDLEKLGIYLFETPSKSNSKESNSNK